MIEIRIEVLSGEAKIHDIDMLIVSGRANKQVFGLEVTMGNSLGVNVLVYRSEKYAAREGRTLTASASQIW